MGEKPKFLDLVEENDLLNCLIELAPENWTYHRANFYFTNSIKPFGIYVGKHEEIKADSGSKDNSQPTEIYTIHFSFPENKEHKPIENEKIRNLHSQLENWLKEKKIRKISSLNEP